MTLRQEGLLSRVRQKRGAPAADSGRDTGAGDGPHVSSQSLDVLDHNSLSNANSTANELVQTVSDDYINGSRVDFDTGNILLRLSHGAKYEYLFLCISFKCCSERLQISLSLPFALT